MTTTTAAQTLSEVIFAELRHAWYLGAVQPGQPSEPDARTMSAITASADVIFAAAEDTEEQPALFRARDEQAAVIERQFISAWKTGANVKLGWATPEGFFDAAVDAVLAAATARKAA